MKTTTYTIHRGTVRSQFALYHHVRSIAVRRSNANEALGKATADLIAAEDDTARMDALVVKYGGDGVYGQAHKSARREQATCSDILRAAQSELKNATARADEASKMHLTPFVPPYVPAKASRVFPALKTCTSQRRATIARQRALFAASIGTPEQARASGFKWYEQGFAAGDDIRVETSLGYTDR